MTIEAGSRLGPYEIVARLGAGGMGEVWQALDPRIGREVAIKVLHPAMSGNEDLVRRFEQEARTAGQLNHPNLIAVHDVGNEGEIAYLVTELLQGDTLRDRLSGGALPTRRAVEWAAGIANGLAAAHEKGIVHRDLKPENIFVTRDNRVKILDFGLARLTNAGIADPVESGVATDHMTEPGRVMGTVGYMSPEQVRAQPVDHRSDIFSFGAILYEMLSGVRAFRRDSSIETMNAILKEEPLEITASNSNVHPVLERIVRHCLEKHPEARFQSARDVAFDLESLSASSGSVRSIAPLDGRRKVWLPVAVAVTALVITTAAFFAGRQTATAGPAEANATSQFSEFVRITFRRGNIVHARLTKDGKVAVFSAAWDGRPMEIYTAQLADRIARPLGIERADVMSVSPTGEIAVLLKNDFVYATAGTGTLARVPLGGGVPRPLLEDVQSADWDPKGETLAVIRYDRKSNEFVLEYPIGKELHRGPNLANVQVSPDGEHVTFMEGVPATGTIELRVIGLDGTPKTLASSRGFGIPVWIATDRIAITDYATSTVHAIDLNGNDSVLLAAPAVEIVDAIPGSLFLFEHELYRSSISYGAVGLPTERELGWLDVPIKPLLTSRGQVLFTEVGGGALDQDGSIYLRGIDGSPAVMLGGGVGIDVSLDGKWVLSQKLSAADALFVVPTGAGRPREIRLAGLTQMVGGAFLHDQRRVFVLGKESDGSIQGALFDLESGASVPVGPILSRGTPLVSPDDLRFAYGKVGGGVVTQKFDGGAIEIVKGGEANDVPVCWSADGRTLWVTANQELPLPVFAIDLESGKRTLWKELIPPDPAGVIHVDAVTIAPDGRSWAYAYSRITADDLYTAKLTGTETTRQEQGGK